MTNSEFNKTIAALEKKACARGFDLRLSFAYRYKRT